MAHKAVGGHFEIQDGGRFRNGKKWNQWISCTGLDKLSEKHNFSFYRKQEISLKKDNRRKLSTCKMPHLFRILPKIH